MIDPWPFLIISAIIDIDFSHEKFSNKRCQSLSTPLERKILLRNTPALCGRFERRFASHRFEVGYEHPTRFQGDVSPRSTVFRSDDQNFQRRGTHPRRSAERERSRWNEIILYGRYSRPCTIEAWWVKIKFFPLSFSFSACNCAKNNYLLNFVLVRTKFGTNFMIDYSYFWSILLLKQIYSFSFALHIQIMI